MGLSQARPGVDKERVVDGTGRLGDRLGRGERQPVGGADHKRVEAVQRVQGGGHATALPAASRLRTSSDTPLSVSNTPIPCRASALKLCTDRKFSASSISSGVRIKSRGRSCLLYWNTTGSCRISTPWARRLSCRFWRLSRLSSKRRAWLSATKTTPSAPWRTSLRVAL